MMDMEKLMKDAVLQSMAGEILKGITTESRAAILGESIVKAMGGWDFKSSLEKAVAEKVAEVAREMLESDEWSSRIHTAVHNGPLEYTHQLKEVLPKVALELMHGKTGERGYGSGPGLILKHLKQN